MIERLIRVSATNKLVVLTLTGALLVVGVFSIRHIAVDALPDLSDTQVIVYSRWDRSPDIIEDQVTYPIVSALLGAPKVKTIRGFSDFGFSYVYVIFEDATDLYWARSRVLEYLSKIQSQLPDGVRTELGPDATGVGWVFQYALVDKSGRHSLADLRSLQDWTIRYELQSVPGVAEVASLGGFVRQYQITVDPNRLASYGIPLMKVMKAVASSNNEVGGRLIEWSGAEYMVRARGYVKKLEDLESIVLAADDRGTPVRLRDVATVQLGPELRRGIAELDGEGEVASGTVVMRHGENAPAVIARVKERLAEIEKTLPEGVEIVTAYDRSELIAESIDTLRHELLLEMLIVTLIILVFLWHLPSAMIPIITLPAAVILSFIPMHFLGINANIMSLGGIAVAIGALVDASIVVIENAHKKLERWQAEGSRGDYREVLIQSVQEVGRPSFFSLLVIACSFLPIFALEAQEGRLFKPLAFTKNFSMAIAAVLAVTLAPALMMLFVRMKKVDLGPRWLSRAANALVVGTLHPEERHPISRVLHRLYAPAVDLVLRRPRWAVTIAVLLVVATVPVYRKLGSEFMPPLNEGSILYMPTTLPGISVTQAGDLLQRQDQILKQFPEVERVFGKAGRAETSTDPAPFSMMETVVTLKPKSEWRTRERWYSHGPDFVKPALRPLWPETLSWEELVDEMNAELTLPGQTNAWTMPIKNRIDMLTTGVRTPVGIKVFGSDLAKIEEIGSRLEGILQDVPGTRSVYAERTAGGYFVDFDLDREQISRYGLTIEDVQNVIMTAIGGENLSTTVEGRERYPINIRYPRELRDDLDELARTLVPAMGGAQVPLGQLARIALVDGPAMIRNENGRLSGYVYVDVDTGRRDIGSWVEEAKRVVAAELELEPGYLLAWSGQYEAMLRVREKMKVVLPLTLFVIVFLVYLNTKSMGKTAIVLLAVPFSAVGAVWLLYALGYNMSIGVWVGLIALLGLDAETGIFMLLYLDLAYEDARGRGRLRGEQDLKEAVRYGAVQRVRPKVMTVATTFLALVPVLWSTGTGADVLQRIAAPMIGGLFTSFLMELLVYPAIFLLWKRRQLPAAEGVRRSAPAAWKWLSAGAGAAAALAIAATLSAGRSAAAPLYPGYEALRQAVLMESLPEARRRAGELAELARSAKREAIAVPAEALAGASDIGEARRALALVSEAMIEYRETADELPKPVVAYCEMERKSWLQRSAIPTWTWRCAPADRSGSSAAARAEVIARGPRSRP